MGKKKKGGPSSGADFWAGVKGWKPVTVGDDLLLGADEYGFCGLEELDASSLGEPASRSARAPRHSLAAPGCDRRFPASPQPVSHWLCIPALLDSLLQVTC